MAQYYIGTSGWVYPHWRGSFYPPALAQSEWLGFYASQFPTVEINNSFYRLPSERAFDGWRDRSPPNFRYAVKASRFITHIRRLKDVAEPLQTFLGRARRLGDKLGPVLYQLPPSMRRDDERLEGFLSLLPPGISHVVEFRHGSWLEADVFDMLRRHNVALCVFDMPGLSCPLLATADCAYIRFHGSSDMYSSRYSDAELEEWASRIGGLARGVKTVYIYFNNDAGGFAIENARTIRDKLLSAKEV